MSGMVERKLTSGSSPLSYAEYQTPGAGQDAPLLFVLHGLFGSADNWHSPSLGIIDLASAADLPLRLVCFDMPGHGGSSRLPALDYRSMAQALAPAIREISHGPSYLLGHSMGGKAAMLLAAGSDASYRVDVEGLMVVDISPKPYPDGHSEYFAAMRRVSQARPQTRKEADALLAETLDNPVVRAFLLKSWIRESQTMWGFDIDQLQDSYEDIRGWDQAAAGGYAGEALWIFGERSQYFSDRVDPALIHALAPKAELAQVAGAGHWVHAEKREEFLQLVWGFLGQRFGV